MKKINVILISVLLISAFMGLVMFAIKRPGGIPVIVKQPKQETLEVPFADVSINLSQGINLNTWEAYPPRELELIYQLMVLPWGKSLVSPINVKAFHNGKDIYFYMSYKDATEDKVLDLDKFSDACAIMFPMSEKVSSSTLMMGFLGGANIWQWKASQDEEYWLGKVQKTEAYVDFYYPFEEEELFVVSKQTVKSAVNDLMAIRVATITHKEIQNVHGRGYWINGFWHVVFKRSLEAVNSEIDAVFNRGKKRFCAFAVWDGSNGDRGGRKSISGLVELNIE